MMITIWFKNETGEMFDIKCPYGLAVAQALWDSLSKAGYNMGSARP